MELMSDLLNSLNLVAIMSSMQIIELSNHESILILNTAILNQLV